MDAPLRRRTATQPWTPVDRFARAWSRSFRYPETEAWHGFFDALKKEGYYYDSIEELGEREGGGSGGGTKPRPKPVEKPSAARFAHPLRGAEVLVAVRGPSPGEGGGKKIKLRERCKGVHFVELGESFPTHIFLQNVPSIQPRTSPSKLDS